MLCEVLGGMVVVVYIDAGLGEKWPVAVWHSMRWRARSLHQLVTTSRPSVPLTRQAAKQVDGWLVDQRFSGGRTSSSRRLVRHTHGGGCGAEAGMHALLLSSDALPRALLNASAAWSDHCAQRMAAQHMAAQHMAAQHMARQATDR